MPSPLPSERQEQVQRLYDEVAALDAEGRAAHLAQCCGEDDALREAVETLLGSPAASGPAVQAGPEQSPAAGPASGTRVGRYEVLDKLGGGGMGVVYQARDTRLDRLVALKFLPPYLSTDPAARTRFAQEARAASQLDHPHICTIHEIGEAADGRLFIAMSYYDGQTLKKHLAAGPLPVDEALGYAVQMARGLAKAHAAGIVHRDVKPANVMVTSDGVVKVLDFGLAKMADVELTRTGATMGTVAYMSPEQARGEAVDARTDVWSLGVVLYEMLTGQRPFDAAYPQAILYGVLHEDPPTITARNPSLTEDVAHVVAMCLEKEPAHRYPSMDDLLADLEVLLQGEGSLQSGERRAASARRPAVPRSVLAGIGGLVSVLLLLLLVPALRQAVPGLGGAASRNPALPDQRFLAVLPFDNVGQTPENQAFIDGLVYTVTSKLTEMEQFQDALSVVPARDVLEAGVFTTRGVADRFDVTLVISGSVQRTDSGVRITLDVIDPAQERVLASRQLDAPLTDIAALQDGVVFKLAELLQVELNPASQKVLTAGRTTVPIAFDFYTQALGYLQHFEDESNISAAISLFELAVKEDPSYALAYAGLAEALLRKYKATNEAALVEQATRNGQRAVDLDDDLAPVHVTLGMIYAETGRDERAELSYLRALALEPSNAEAQHQLGAVYYRQGKFDKAEASYQKAIALKPGYWLYPNSLGQLYHRLGRHAEAIPLFKRVIALQPDNPWGYNNVGVQYNRMGEADEAIEWYLQATRVNPRAVRATAFAYRNLAGIYYSQDRFQDAARMFEQAVGLQPADYQAWVETGDAQYWAGNRPAATAAWRRAVGLSRERLAVNQQDAEALGFLAETYARLGQQDSARVSIDRLVAMDGLSTEALVSIGKASEILGQRDRALRYLGAALERGYTPEVLVFSAWLDALRADPAYQRLVQAAPAPPDD